LPLTSRFQAESTASAMMRPPLVVSSFHVTIVAAVPKIDQRKDFICF